MIERTRPLGLSVSSALLLAACGVGGEAGSVGSGGAVPDPEVRPAVVAGDPSPTIEASPVTPNAGGGSMPGLGGLDRLFSSGAGGAATSGGSVGSGTFALATVMDFNAQNVTGPFGSGSWTNIVASGQAYSASTGVYSAAGLFLDDSTGAEYLVLVAWTEETSSSGAIIGTQLNVVVPSADFAVGAQVNLDGWDRYAVFARGDLSLPDPEQFAVALTGTVSFSGGSLSLGDSVSGDLIAEFVDYALPPAPSGGSISSGSYNLSFDSQAYVYCEGSLAGAESAFSGLVPADLGFVDGPVAVNVQGPDVDVSGAPVAAILGQTSALLQPSQDTPPGLVFAYVLTSGIPGPSSTERAGTYLVLEGDLASTSSIPGYGGAWFVTPAQDGYCDVAFGAALMP